MVAATLASAASAPLVFLGDLRLAAVGMALWGLGTGAQESVMRAAVPSDSTKEQARNGLRYDEHDIRRRLVRRQRAAGRSLRPNVGALGCARLRGPAIGCPSCFHTADPTRRLSRSMFVSLCLVGAWLGHAAGFAVNR